MKATKVRVIRIVKAGYLLMKLPKGDNPQFQFCSHKLWKDLGGPKNVAVKDTYTLNVSTRAYPRINWESVKTLKDVDILNIGNPEQFGECVVVRDNVEEHTIKVSSGHWICCEAIHSSVPVSEYDPDFLKGIHCYMTPTGYDRAVQTSGVVEKASHVFSAPEQDAFLSQFIGGSEDGS